MKGFFVFFLIFSTSLSLFELFFFSFRVLFAFAPVKSVNACFGSLFTFLVNVHSRDAQFEMQTNG
jgi:hypothetical protein